MDTETIARIREDWDREFQRYERKEPVAGFPALPDIPAARYTDSAFYELEQRHLWRTRWLIAGHVDEVPDVGSYKVWRQLGEPILLVRGKDKQIRAFFNTCRHRGASVAKCEAGRAPTLVCQYHHWTYDLTGHLVFVPSEQDFPGLDKSKRALAPVRCELWGNLIFVNLNPDAGPLLSYVAPLLPDFSDFDLDEVKLIKKVTHELKCNWKVLVDAFQENYHFDAVHPQTINLMLDNRRQHVSMFRNGHSRLIPRKRFDTPVEAQVLDRNRSTDDPRHEITREGARTYMVFPNIIAATAEFQWFLMAFWPMSINTSRLETFYLAPPGFEDPESPQCQEVIKAFEYVTIEDVSNLVAVQESMESGAFESIPLSAMERRIYQHHEEIDRVIGVERVPEALRVKPMLKAFEE
ncbi:MAG: aromatic ring-hydroxylating dioxygenase subunit alpha [Steroidobacteraceae bacterium]